MLGVLKEILAVMLFEPKPIANYQKISEKPLALILLLMVVTIGYISPIRGASFFGNYLFLSLATYLVIYIAAVFFQYWFRLKGINVELKALFVMITLVLAMNILILPNYILARYFDLFFPLYINLVLVSYSVFVFVFAFAKSLDNLSYALIGTVLCTLPVFLMLAILHALFISFGLLPMPV